METITNFLQQTGFSRLMDDPKVFVMMLIAFVLMYLAIKKGFEPLLLLPIAFGMLLTNLPGANMYHTEFFSGGHVHWDQVGNFGLIDYLYLGVKLGIYPSLIFLGVGAMTDFGPLVANPKSLLLGAAAQLGIFLTYLGASAMGFTPAEASSIGIIGGAYGPTAIFLSSKRPDSYLCNLSACTRPSGTDCGCCLFLYGTCAGDSASDYEGSDDKEGTADRDEAAASREED